MEHKTPPLHLTKCIDFGTCSKNIDGTKETIPACDGIHTSGENSAFPPDLLTSVPLNIFLFIYYFILFYF